MTVASQQWEVSRDWGDIRGHALWRAPGCPGILALASLSEELRNVSTPNLWTLPTTVAIGYRRGADDRLEQDPDLRIRKALSLVFRKFSEIGSVRQLALWLREEGIDLPGSSRLAQMQ